MVATSPPFWGLRSYGLSHDEGLLERWLAEGHEALETPPYEWYRRAGGVLGLEPYPEWFVDHLAEIFDLIAPAIKPDGSVWVNLGDTYFARWSSIREDSRQGIAQSDRRRRRTPSGGWRRDKQLLMIPARFAIAMQERGWILRNDLIWSKRCVAPRPERDRLRLSHEHFFHFVLRRSGGRPSYYYDLGGAEDRGLDVVSTRVENHVDHTATYPTELVLPRILSSCPPGGVVLDPFCGSGTTLAAAVANDRRAIGFDVNESSVRSSRSRIGAAARRGAAEPLAS